MGSRQGREGVPGKDWAVVQGLVNDLGGMQSRGEAWQTLTAPSEVTPPWLHSVNNTKIQTLYISVLPANKKCTGFGLEMRGPKSPPRQTGATTMKELCC